MTNIKQFKLTLLVGLSLLFVAVYSISVASAAFVNYQSTVVVSPVGPTSADNGMALVMALNDIATGVPAPSTADRYLLKIEPGVFDVGSVALQIPSYVDMEGSGEDATLIRGHVGDALSAGTGVVTVADNAGVRHFTVENYADGDAIDSAALLLLGGAQAAHVTAVSTGTSTINRALMTALDEPPAAQVSNVTATAQTRAAQVFFPGLEAENVVANGSQGLLVSSGNVLLRNSRITGDDFSMLVTNLPQRVNVVGTQLAGPVSCTSKNCRCFAAYNHNLRELKRRCVGKKKP